MAFDRAGTRRVENWLHGHGGSVHCPIRGDQHWAVGDIPSPPAAEDGGAAGASEGHPLVRVVRGNRGYVMLFSARIMGL